MCVPLPPRARRSRSRIVAAEVSQASSRCEQQSRVSESSSRRSSIDSMSAIVLSASRNSAARREPWNSSPTSCIPIPLRSSSVRGSTPAICWIRVGAAIDATGFRAATAPRSSRPTCSSRCRAASATTASSYWPCATDSRADRTSPRSTSTRAPSTASNNGRTSSSRKSRSRLSASTSRACASSTWSTLFAAAGRGTTSSRFATNALSLSCTSGSASDLVFLPTSKASSSESGSMPASSRITFAICSRDGPDAASGRLIEAAVWKVGSGETALRTRSARSTASVPRIVGSASSRAVLSTVTTDPMAASHMPRTRGVEEGDQAAFGEPAPQWLPRLVGGDDRQHAVRLPAEAQRGQRPPSPDVVDPVRADGVQGRVVQPVLTVVAPRRAERLDRVAPGGAPQGRVERPGAGLLGVRPVRQGGQQVRADPQRRRRHGGVRSRAQCVGAVEVGWSGRRTPAPRRPGGVGVVRGGALRHELRAVGEAVRADESLEPSGRLAGLGRGPDAVDGQLADRLVGAAAARS